MTYEILKASLYEETPDFLKEAFSVFRTLQGAHIGHCFPEIYFFSFAADV